MFPNCSGSNRRRKAFEPFRIPPNNSFEFEEKKPDQELTALPQKFPMALETAPAAPQKKTLCTPAQEPAIQRQDAASTAPPAPAPSPTVPRDQVLRAPPAQELPVREPAAQEAAPPIRETAPLPAPAQEPLVPEPAAQETAPQVAALPVPLKKIKKEPVTEDGDVVFEKWISKTVAEEEHVEKNVEEMKLEKEIESLKRQLKLKEQRDALRAQLDGGAPSAVSLAPAAPAVVAPTPAQPFDLQMIVQTVVHTMSMCRAPVQAAVAPVPEAARDRGPSESRKKEDEPQQQSAPPAKRGRGRPKKGM